jgi:hypothetical protein
MSVATFAHRNESKGTWFVDVIISQLESLTENLSLLDFLVRVQNALCFRTKFGDSGVGQTPQLQFFRHKKLTLCATLGKQMPGVKWYT